MTNNNQHHYYQNLLQPLSGDRPCGENLEYDAGFIMLQARLQPRLGAEYGSFFEAAEPVNWAEIERDCQALLQRGRDIRLVIALMRCRLRQVGTDALFEGLRTLCDLLTAFPTDLYPQLTEEGEFDPVMRANALSELDDSNGLLADLRQLSLPKAAGLQIAVKDFEKACATPREAGALSEETVAALRLEWETCQHPTFLSLQKAQVCLTELQAILTTSLGTNAPDLMRLNSLLRLFVGHENRGASPMQAGLPAEPEASDPTAQAEMPAAEEPGGASCHALWQTGLASRADVLLRLQELRRWFTQMEPGSPAILLLHFAEKTVGKSFSQLVKMLPQEMLEKLDSDSQ